MKKQKKEIANYNVNVVDMIGNWVLAFETVDNEFFVIFMLCGEKYE